MSCENSGNHQVQPPGLIDRLDQTERKVLL